VPGLEGDNKRKRQQEKVGFAWYQGYSAVDLQRELHLMEVVRGHPRIGAKGVGDLISHKGYRRASRI